MYDILQFNYIRVSQLLKESDLSDGRAWYPLVGMLKPDLLKCNYLFKSFITSVS
jgi:hypothetical protein